MCVCSYLCDESRHRHLSSNDSAKWDAKANFQDICVITKYNKIKCKKANMKKNTRIMVKNQVSHCINKDLLIGLNSVILNMLSMRRGILLSLIKII